MHTHFSRTIRKLLLSTSLLLTSCSSMQEREEEKIRRQNCKREAIFRSENDRFAPEAVLTPTPRAAYPWESDIHLSRITKDFFRCKGSSLNPPLLAPEPLTDCEGATRHGLPILAGQEGVYPILIDLLNHVQKKTGKRVVITCGHRCPLHNTYADPSSSNKVSKHQLGAEVDFYVQGLEESPGRVIEEVLQYFKETSPYKSDKESLDFKRMATDVSTPLWLNKDVCVKLFQKEEGRDFDNRHLHPYISIQVRYDRASQEKVVYSWAKANQGYPRF